MVTYVAVVVVVALMLYLSFRALGGGSAVAAEDYRTVLARIGQFAAERAAELEAALREAAGRSREAAQREADPLVAAAAAARKKLSGYQEQLARLEPDAEGEERETLDAARSLLSAGIEDLGWACRMLEAGNHADNTGVQRAVGELRAAGGECLEAAARLLGPVVEASAEVGAGR